MAAGAARASVRLAGVETAAGRAGAGAGLLVLWRWHCRAGGLRGGRIRMRYSRLRRSLRRAGLVGGLGVVALVVSQGTGTAAPAAEPAHRPAAVGCAWVPTTLPALASG